MNTSSASKNHEPHSVVKLRMHRPDLENLPPTRLPAGYTLRHHHGGDEAAWLDLFRRIFADDPRSGVAPKTEQDLRDEFLSSPDWKPERMWFAIAPDGQPAGMAMAWVTVEAVRPVAILHWVGVLGVYRGKHLGETLALACLHQHKRDGWPDCWLTTEDFRAAAIRIYERLGFAVAYTMRDPAPPT